MLIKRKRNSSIFSIIVLLILVLSTVGFALISSGGNEGTTNNDDSYIGDGYVKDVQGTKLYFSYKPSEVENISIDITKTLGDYGSSTLYIDSENKTFKILKKKKI